MVITKGKLQQRIEHIQQAGYKVLSLDEAIEALYNNSLAENSIVITIDDGWYSTYSVAHPLFKKYSIPYTLYVTSYYAEKGTPLFNHALRYMLWKGKGKEANLKNLSPKIPGLSHFEKPEEKIEKIIDYGHSYFSHEQREALAEEIGQLLGVDYQQLKKRRTLSSLNAEEIRKMYDEGADIQLHSYRHRWPLKRAAANEELEQDRQFLEPLTGKKLHHFCYPSGIFSQEQFVILQQNDIKSATTCINGLNTNQTNRYALKRFLDHQGVSQLEFEAEIAGLLPALRKLLS